MLSHPVHAYESILHGARVLGELFELIIVYAERYVRQEHCAAVLGVVQLYSVDFRLFYYIDILNFLGKGFYDD